MHWSTLSRSSDENTIAQPAWLTVALAVLSGPLIVGATAVGLGVALLPPEQAVSAIALVIRATRREVLGLSTEVNLA